MNNNTPNGIIAGFDTDCVQRPSSIGRKLENLLHNSSVWVVIGIATVCVLTFGS
jgi:hypothetical protein